MPAAAPSSAPLDDELIMKAVESFADQIDKNQILADLFKDVDDGKLLDLLTNFFMAALGGKSDTEIKTTFTAMVAQNGIADDHYLSAATSLHTVLTEYNVPADTVDAIMNVVDLVRIDILDS
jgi:truncated hemoglobin YjbI